MTKNHRSTLSDIVAALCRLHFPSFILKCFLTLTPGRVFQRNWHINAMAFRLEQVRQGEINRLMVNVPPRHLKSIVASVAFPAFVLGHDPTKRVIVITYGSQLSAKLMNDFRTIIAAPWYLSMFPETRVSRNKNTEFEVVTTRGGYRLATSIDGPLTGWGADIVIVDDPLKLGDAPSDRNREHVNDFCTTNLVPRLDDKKNGAIVIVMQRLHVNDPCGTLLRASDRWNHLNLPAIAEQDEEIQIGEKKYHFRRVGDLLHPAREPMSELETTRSEMGSDNFAAQYQQSSVPPGGAIVKREWIGRYDRLPVRTASSRIIESWDTTSKLGEQNSWSACTTWLVQDHRYYLTDVLRGRFDYPELKANAIAHARRFRPDRILIEDSGVGTALIAELRKNGLTAIAIKPELNKRTRMSIQAGKFESGQVFFPNRAPGLAELEAELFSFPYAPHDDQVDSIAQALADLDAPGWTNAALAGYSSLLEGLAFSTF